MSGKRPFAGDNFSAPTVEDAVLMISTGEPTDPGEPYAGMLTLTESGMVIRYEAHVFAGGELTASWLDDRNLASNDDGRQLYIVPKDVWHTDVFLEYVFGRRPGVFIGSTHVPPGDFGTFHFRGANLFPEGNGDSTLTAEGAAGIAYAESVRTKDLPLARGLWGGVMNPKVPAVGGAGGESPVSDGSNALPGTPGGQGENGGVGGGGSGETWSTRRGGHGADGYVFGGGGGGAGGRDNHGLPPESWGEPFSGRGGSNPSNLSNGGGAGNPAGPHASNTADDFTGGVAGLLGATVTGMGTISVDGGVGGDRSGNNAGAGGSGAGSASVLCTQYSGSIVVSAAGGVAGLGWTPEGPGPGGDGYAAILVKGAA